MRVVLGWGFVNSITPWGEQTQTAVTALGVMVFDSCVQLFDGPTQVNDTFEQGVHWLEAAWIAGSRYARRGSGVRVQPD